MPAFAFFVSVWTIFAFSYALTYRGNDRYGFIPIADREHSFWNTIDVVSARVGACFDEALVSFDSSQIKDYFANEREVQVVMKWLAIFYAVQIICIWAFIISWKALFHE